MKSLLRQGLILKNKDVIFDVDGKKTKLFR